MEHIGERIESLMKEEKLSQKELAIMAGVTEATLSRYINNERQPKAEILANIATALNTTSDYLINGKTEKLDFAEIYRFVARPSKGVENRPYAPGALGTRLVRITSAVPTGSPVSV